MACIVICVETGGVTIQRFQQDLSSNWKNPKQKSMNDRILIPDVHLPVYFTTWERSMKEKSLS